MPNYPGPYELEFELDSASFVSNHVLRVSCTAPADIPLGTSMSDADLLKKSGATIKALAAANQMWSFFRLLYATNVTAGLVRLWKYIPGTLARDLVSTGNLTTPAGATGSTSALSYTILSFYTGAGGQLKIFFSEPNITSNAQVPLSTLSPTSAQNQIADYVISGDSVIIGRDNGFAIAKYRFSAGQHEKFWSKQYR